MTLRAKWRRVLSVLGLVGWGAACAADKLSIGEPVRCEAVTRALIFAPEVVNRGEALQLSVVWELDMEVVDPVARLLVGEGDVVEVRVALDDVSSADAWTYTGALLNPFGVGAPAGAGAAVVRGETCVPVEAATSFHLE